MANVNVTTPELDLVKADQFYLFYEVMIQSLKTDNVREGVSKSLSMFREFLDSGNVSFFKKNNKGIYIFKESDSEMPELIQPIGCIINKMNSIIEHNGIFSLDESLSERIQNLMFVHIKTCRDNDCILVILNRNKEKELDAQFWERVKETMQIICKRAESYEYNIKAITTDLLTGLENRNSYEMRISSFNEADDNLVLAIFDLFRLKYINDNYNHEKGDEYIKGVGNILNKYWPKQKVKTSDDGIEEYSKTGHCVYRIGGDEFVLLTTEESLQLATIKANLAKTDSELLNLNIGSTVPIGMNYGIVKHKPGDSFKETLINADKLMQEDKAEKYKTLGLERRHY